jgi:probable addiction module antidote protein
MPKRTRSYRSWQLVKLANPELAASYLNAAMNDSPEIFLKALGRVAQARQMAAVAKQSGVARESLYRALSSDGNPTLGTLHSVLQVLGLKITISAESSLLTAPSPSSLEGKQPPYSYQRSNLSGAVGQHASGTQPTLLFYRPASSAAPKASPNEAEYAVDLVRETQTLLQARPQIGQSTYVQ